MGCLTYTEKRSYSPKTVKNVNVNKVKIKTTMNEIVRFVAVITTTNGIMCREWCLCYEGLSVCL